MGRVALAVLSTLFAALTAEVGLRAWLRFESGSGYDAAQSEARLRADRERATAYVPHGADEGKGIRDGHTLKVLHPYTGVERRHDTGGVLAFFARGVPDDTYVIVVVGGSVAEQVASEWEAVLRSGKGALPGLIADAVPEERVVVLNYAHAAYKQPQQLMRIAYLFSLGHRPDAVINLDGFNEVVASQRNALQGTHPAYPSPSVWGAWTNKDPRDARSEALRAELWMLRERERNLADSMLSLGGHRSAWLFLWSRVEASKLRRETARAQAALVEASSPSQRSSAGREWLRRQALGPDFDPQRVREQALRIWAESSRSIAQLCSARDIPYLHVLQPCLRDEGAKPVSKKERRLVERTRDWTAAAAEAYPELRRVAAELQANDVSLFDASGVFAEFEGAAYIDSVHLTRSGVAHFTEAVARAFIELVR